MTGIRTKAEGIQLKELSNELKIPFVRIFSVLWRNRFYTDNNPESCLSIEDYEKAKIILKNHFQRD